ncbi:MAG TPA: site-2 protease family protein [Methylomirabilota bacterium]|nr:site-2 protease family protein [Methylomirabilota bacterium]
MRFWPARRRWVAAPFSVDDALLSDELVRQRVDDVLKLEAPRPGGKALVYRGRLLMAPARARELLQARLRPLGLTPFLTSEGDDVVLQALPLAEGGGQRRVRLNVVLFILTCLSTLLAGAFFSGSPTFDAFRTTLLGTLFVSGIPFASTLLGILAVHEFGHYFTARHYRASVSLPYFIPAPPPLFLFGTLGALIQMRSPARDRNALFDIAAAGPLAGLVVAVPALLVGLQWSAVVPTPPTEHVVFGQSLLMRWLVQAQFGVVPDGMMLFTHPVADAAWAGFFVTALNLFPVGQLDGGRIAYALFGRHHRTVGVATVVATIGLGLITWSPNWFVWSALVVFLIGLHHSPPLDDVTPLSPGRRAVGALCLILFVLLIPPVPIDIS